MTESSERKIKLLLLYEILRKQTDERHPMTTGELSEALQNFGIAVSRKTLYWRYDTAVADSENKSKRRQRYDSGNRQ